MNPWKNLSPSKKLFLKLRALQDPLFFWESPYFCKLTLWDPPEHEITQRKILQEFYRRDPLTGYRLYNELVVQAGMRSSKTFIAGCIGAYEIFKVIQWGNPNQGITPAEYYGLAPGSEIFILSVAAKEDQSRDTIYAQIKSRVETNAYFRSEEVVGFDFENKSDVQKLRMNFEAYKLIVLAIGSNAKTGVGRTVKAALIDELNKFTGSADRLSGKEMYDLITKSTSTFFQRNKVVINEDIKAIVASPMYEGDIVNAKVKTAHLNPYRLAYEVPTWVLNTEYTKEALLAKCKDDMNDFLLQYGGVALGAHVVYFKKKERIQSCMNPSLENWGITETMVRDEFTNERGEGYILDLPEKIPKGTYTIAGDPSLRNDAFGISIWHREFREVAPDKWDDFYVGDSFIRLLPLKKIEHIKDVSLVSGEIDPFKIKTLFMDACRRLPIEVALFDTWMFPSVTDAIENCGVPVIQNIVDKEEYDVFKDILYRKRAEMSQYPFVVDELSKLILKHGKKVDHPSGGSKDVADSSANCVFYLTGEWEARKMKKTAKNKYVNPIKGFNPLFFG